MNGLEQCLLSHRNSINGSFPGDEKIKGLQGCCHSENCIFLLVTHLRGSYFLKSESHGNLHLVLTWLPTSGSWVTTSFQKRIWKIDVRRGIGELSANGPHWRGESQMIGKAAATSLGGPMKVRRTGYKDTRKKGGRKHLRAKKQWTPVLGYLFIFWEFTWIVNSDLKVKTAKKLYKTGQQGFSYQPLSNIM